LPIFGHFLPILGTFCPFLGTFCPFLPIFGHFCLLPMMARCFCERFARIEAPSIFCQS
jgi:hypothetical protein